MSMVAPRPTLLKHRNANKIAKATDWMSGVSLRADTLPQELVGDSLS
jgi:hypothetical protein